MSATIDITCEYCAAQRHECSVWRKVENYDDCTRREVWCCNVCWEGGEEYEKGMCEEMGEEFTGQNTKVLEIINDDDEEEFEEDDHGVLCFKSETDGWLYAEPYCFNCGHRARDGDCTCEEDEMDWREAEYEAK